MLMRRNNLHKNFNRGQTPLKFMDVRASQINGDRLHNWLDARLIHVRRSGRWPGFARGGRVVGCRWQVPCQLPTVFFLVVPFAKD